MKWFAVLITLFMLPFCIFAVRECVQDYRRNDGFPKWLTVAWGWYAIGGTAIILFLAWGAALDPQLQ